MVLISTPEEAARPSGGKLAGVVIGMLASALVGFSGWWVAMVVGMAGLTGVEIGWHGWVLGASWMAFGVMGGGGAAIGCRWPALGGLLETAAGTGTIVTAAVLGAPLGLALGLPLLATGVATAASRRPPRGPGAVTLGSKEGVVEVTGGRRGRPSWTKHARSRPLPPHGAAWAPGVERAGVLAGRRRP